MRYRMTELTMEYSEEDGYRIVQVVYIGTYEGKSDEELKLARQKLVDKYLANGAATDKQPKKQRWPRRKARVKLEFPSHLIAQALREGKGSLEEPLLIPSDVICYYINGVRIPCIVKACT